MVFRRSWLAKSIRHVPAHPSTMCPVRTGDQTAVRLCESTLSWTDENTAQLNPLSALLNMWTSRKQLIGMDELRALHGEPAGNRPQWPMHLSLLSK